MASEARKVLSEVTDRRILRGSAEAYGDYWPTCAVAILWVLFFFHGAHEKGADFFWLFCGAFVVALAAARDAKKEVHRKIDAIVRRMEEKGLV